MNGFQGMVHGTYSRIMRVFKQMNVITFMVELKKVKGNFENTN